MAISGATRGLAWQTEEDDGMAVYLATHACTD
jgi:hypothetical protein